MEEPESLKTFPIVDEIRKDFEEKFARFVNLESQATIALEAPAEIRELNGLEIAFLGKKSRLAAQLKKIGTIDPRSRREFAMHLQNLQTDIRARITREREVREEIVRRWRTQRDSIDVSIPGRRPRAGHLHPITLMRQRIEDIFVSLGYIVEDDREIETDFYNFDALNIPEGHPARDPQDTFYTTEGFALRSQTSTVQIHAMQRRGAPVRMIAPGRVFRRDTPDPTHNPMFFQVEGLCVDRGITMAHLKGTLAEFVHRLFGSETQTRFRPSYFPFTEPSAEVDYSCFNCGGSGCRICKHSGWIELGGSGMVHPNVLRAANIDPEEFTGFAFGLGIDRTCARIYQLDDIRLLFENDVRFLEQFR
jgi:phenylalanyl-tRNA synthetase alpha chain